MTCGQAKSEKIGGHLVAEQQLDVEREERFAI
jgi:hypothetical protein